MHIGLLLAGHTQPEITAAYGDFDAMFARLLDGQDFTFTAYDVEHMTFPDSVQDADGWLISGSRHGAYEDHAFIPPLEQFIRDTYAADIPMVGICFGHQIIAQALGGTVIRWPDGWGLGRHAYDLSGETIHLNAWHQDQVTDLPEGATTIASSPFCANAILAYGDRAFTVQAHPEFTTDILSDYVAQRRGTGTYPDDRMDAAGAAAGQPLDNQRLARAIGRFFHERTARV